MHGAIGVHGGFRQASFESGPSGQEVRTLQTGQLRPPRGKENIVYRVFRSFTYKSSKLPILFKTSLDVFIVNNIYTFKTEMIMAVWLVE